MMGKKSVKAGVVGACAAMVIFGGAAAANAGWTSSAESGASVASVKDARTQITVRDGAADGNRAYANYWRNNSSSRYQLVTNAYRETQSATMSGSTRVASFQACNDHPVSGDTCATRKYI